MRWAFLLLLSLFSKVLQNRLMAAARKLIISNS